MSPSGTASAASPCAPARDVELWSKSGKPLARYFPEVAAMFGRLKATRVHPRRRAADRHRRRGVLRRAAAAPPPGRKPSPQAVGRNPGACSWPSTAWRWARKCLAREPLSRAPRRARETARRRKTSRTAACRRPPTDRDGAIGWLERTGGALDGVVAKRLDVPYRPGERAMVKVKQRRTADCVVGGFRYGREGQAGRLAAARPLRRRRPAPPCRLHLVDRRQGPPRLDRGAGSA